MTLIQTCRFNDLTSNSVVFTTSLSTSGGFALNTYCGGMILVASGSTSTTLTFYVKTQSDSSTSFQAYDSTGTAVTLSVVGGRCYPIPDELFGAFYVTATTGSGTVTCQLLLKG
jgi:hypothetical protein